MSKKFIAITSASLLAIITAWGVFVVFDWGEEYFATKQSPRYEALPFEFKLKSDPKDVIFSEAYTAGDGKDVVKYAYVAGEVGPQINEDITRRTPESYTEVIERKEGEKGVGTETLKTTFFSKPQFYENEGQWKQIEYATTTPEIFALSGAIPYIKKRELVERLLPGREVFAQTSTFYPDPNAETNSVDGYVGSTELYSDVTVSAACFEAFSLAVTNTNGSVSDDFATSLRVSVYNEPLYEDPFWSCTAIIERVYALFNTATLPDIINLTSAQLSLYVTGKSNDDNDGTDTINIVSANPASNTALSTADYDEVGLTLYASAEDITSISTGAYKIFSLNSTGKAAVTPTGVSKFGVREGHDIAGTRPGNSNTNSVTFSSADTSGTSQDPKLEVTYTVPFSFGFWFPF